MSEGGQGWEILQGDVLDCLAGLPDESVQCVVTSPPYWGLRDYGAEGMIGLEETPQEHVEKLVGVFREVRRVLKPDGVCWVNYGDCYAANRTAQVPDSKHRDVGNRGSMSCESIGLAAKNLVGMAWRVAFALQEDGWILRSDVIWSKPNPMPESVRDRPTRAHEYVFLFAKRPRYYWNADAVREAAEHRRWRPGRQNEVRDYPGTRQSYSDGPSGYPTDPNGRNVRTVWSIPTQPFPDAHFATFPERLVERCIRPASRRGDTVLDPFAGSGTVGIVSVREGRRFVGIDLSPEYCEMARGRLAHVVEQCDMFEASTEE